jgi:hypothetical protein
VTYWRIVVATLPATPLSILEKWSFDNMEWVGFVQ